MRDVSHAARTLTVIKKTLRYFLTTSLSENGIDSGATSCATISRIGDARPALSAAGPLRRCIRHFYFFSLLTVPSI
jgi:hypothetical protein